MIRPICKDILFLRQKAEQAAKDDMDTVQDLLDTLKANEDGSQHDWSQEKYHSRTHGICKCGND